MRTTLNSLIFHTPNLSENKAFYQSLFDFKVGFYEKDGQLVPDESYSYVNFDLDGTLLCFESAPQVDKGSLVLQVDSLEQFKNKISAMKIELLKQGSFWLKIRDPDGRSLIVEQRQ